MDPYQLGDKLGEGAMGEVFEAVRQKDGQVVALKLLKMACPGDEDGLEAVRFFREQQISPSLRHPNIVKILEVGRMDGRPFVAMEKLEAETLGQRLDRLGMLPVVEMVDILVQVFAALEYLHERGIIHRDLKPANIMVDASGHATLMDFGLVKDLNRSALTETGYLVGSPAYLAPEVIGGSELVPGSELFSVATLAYECLTGFKPFRGETLEGLLGDIVMGEPVPVPQVRPDCPQSLGHFLATCHRKHPADRFASAREAREYLEVLRATLESPGAAKLPLLPALPPERIVPKPPRVDAVPRPRGRREDSRPSRPPAAGEAGDEEGPRGTGPVPVSAIATGVVLLGLALLIPLQLRRAGPPETARPGPAGPVELEVRAGLASLEVRAPEDTPPGLSVEVISLTSAAAAQRRLLSPREPALFSGLQPESDYRLRVLGPKDETLSEKPARTASAVSQVSRLVELLARFDAARRVTKVASMSRSSEEAVVLARTAREDLRQLSVPDVLDELLGADVRFITWRSVEPAVASRLTEGLWQLADLDRALAGFGEKLGLPDALEKSLAGSVAPGSGGSPARVIVSFGGKIFPAQLLTGTFKIFRVPFPGALTDARSGEDVLSLEPDAGVVAHELEPELELPPGAKLERCQLGIGFSASTPPVRLRVLVADAGGPWVPLTSFRPAGAKQTLYQELPARLLGSGRVRLKLELVDPSPDVATPRIVLDWLDLTYDAAKG